MWQAETITASKLLSFSYFLFARLFVWFFRILFSYFKLLPADARDSGMVSLKRVVDDVKFQSVFKSILFFLCRRSFNSMGTKEVSRKGHLNSLSVL